VSVVVAVTTFRRPEGLARLLQSLAELRFVHRPPPDVHVLVVDNDPGRTAESTCARFAGVEAWSVEYQCEPRRGITAARNRALEAATRRADFTAFVDDDQRVEPSWLDHLLTVADRYRADVVFGPVLPRFDVDAPRWVHRGGVFDRPRRATGARVRLGGTGNCLLRNATLRETGITFDDRFGLTGGEDTHFFLRLNRRGLDMRWADDAIVHEHVPAARTRVGWIWRRAFRVGCTWSLSEQEVTSSAMLPLLRVAKGVTRCVQGLAMLVVAPVRGRHAVVRAGQVICTGAGNVAGVCGFAPRIYS
jgi:GT2 family glycosyltransferase